MGGHSGRDNSSSPESNLQQVRVGDWLVQPQLNRLVHPSGKQQLIKPKVMDVLVCLAEHPNGVVAKQQLCERVWAGTAVTDDVLTQAVCDLRKSLGDDAKNPRYIQTVPKRGYRLIAPVRPLPGPAEAGAAKGLSPPLRRVAAGLAALLLLPAFIQIGRHVLQSSAAGKAAGTKTVAVLPFQTLSDPADGDRLAQGFRDSLAVNLAKLLDVSIVAADSLVPSQDGGLPASAISNLDAVVKGAVQRSGSRIRVSVRLIDPAARRVMWADEFEGRADDLFMLQDRVATAAAKGLETRLAARAARTWKPRGKAHLAFLRATHLLNKGTRESMQAAARHFEQTIRMEPDFPGGYLGLAQSYLQRGSGFGTVPAPEALAKARQAASKALDLQPGIAEALAVLASVDASRLRFQDAEREYQEALALNPGSSAVHSEYGLLLATLGRNREALLQTALALELDPVSLEANTVHGRVLLYTDEIDRAIARLQATIELEPEAPAPRYFLYWSHLKQGDLSAARKSLFKFYRLLGLPADAISALGDAYERAGFAGVAEKELQWIEQGRHPMMHSPVYRARLYARADRAELALDWLEKAYNEEYYYGLEMLAVDPVYRFLRPRPRFQRLLGQIGFPSDAGSQSGPREKAENAAGLKAGFRTAQSAKSEP